MRITRPAYRRGGASSPPPERLTPEKCRKIGAELRFAPAHAGIPTARFACVGAPTIDMSVRMSEQTPALEPPSRSPRKLVIFGNSGAGKSTLAQRLAREGALAHLDLDSLAWLPTEPP